MVPYSLLLEQCEQLEHNLLTSTVDIKTVFNQTLVHDQKDYTDKLQECVLKQSHLFLSWVQGIQNLKTLTVDKEIQKTIGLLIMWRRNLVKKATTSPYILLVTNIVYLERHGLTLCSLNVKKAGLTKLP